MALEKSGFNYSNKFARIYLESLYEVMSRDDVRTLMTAAGLPRLADYLPPDNLEKSFDFTYFTAIRFAFTEAFGEEDGDALAYASGRASFRGGLRRFGDLVVNIDLTHRDIPLEDKLEIGLSAMSEVAMQFSDQISRVYPFDEETYIYTLERCPMCWGQRSNRAMCHIGQGLVSESLSWLANDRQFHIETSACVAAGDEMGRYIIYREPIR